MDKAALMNVAVAVARQTYGMARRRFCPTGQELLNLIDADMPLALRELARRFPGSASQTTQLGYGRGNLIRISDPASGMGLAGKANQTGAARGVVEKKSRNTKSTTRNRGIGAIKGANAVSGGESMDPVSGEATAGLISDAISGLIRLIERILDAIEDKELRDEAEKQVERYKIKVLEPGMSAWRNLAEFARDIDEDSYEDLVEMLEQADDKSAEALDAASRGLDKLSRDDKEGAKQDFDEASRLAGEAARMYARARRAKKRALRAAIRRRGSNRTPSD